MIIIMMMILNTVTINMAQMLTAIIMMMVMMIWLLLKKMVDNHDFNDGVRYENDENKTVNDGYDDKGERYIKSTTWIRNTI
jgi:hypothetical protein